MTPPVQPFTQGHALIMAAGGDLPATVNDAQGLAAILTDPSRCAYPPQQVALLTGEGAGRQALLDGLAHLAERTTADDTAIVYFSGHGCRVTSPLGPLYFLLPNGYDPADLAGTAIRGDEFQAALARIPAGRLLLLLDCCHAGGLEGIKSGGLTFAKAPLPAPDPALLAQGRGRAVIASSRADELSYAGTPYSVFTLALLEALCGEGASQLDGYVRVADLALYAGRKVPQRTDDRQHPLLDYAGADNFRVAWYAGGDAQPKGLPFDPAQARIDLSPDPFASSAGGDTIHNTGSGAVATRGGVAAGQGGVAVGGDVHGGIRIGNGK